MKTVEEIQQMLNETVNTLLGQHRGRVDVVKVERSEELPIIAFIKMSGGCRGCAGAKATLTSIVSSSIKEFDPTIQFVLDSTDHSDKTEAFFKE